MPIKIKPSPCAIQVAETIEGLDPEDLEPFARMLDQENKRLGTRDLGAIAEGTAQEIGIDNKRRLTQAFLTKEAVINLTADAIRFNRDNLVKGMEANGVGISLNRPKGRSGAMAMQLQEANHNMNGFWLDLEEAGENLTHDFRKDIYQDDIIDALELMDKAGPVDLSAFHPDAIKIAELWRKWDIKVVDALNASGANIKYRWDWSLPQYFDDTKLTFASEITASQHNWRQMLGEDFSKRTDEQVEASWQAFWNDERKSLDMAVMEERFAARLDEKFGPEPSVERQAAFEEQLETFMREVYIARASGLHLANSPSNSFDAIMPNGKSLAQRLSEGRIVHYKAGGFKTLFRKYGRGGLHDAFMQYLDMSGRHIGLMEKFGPNPELTFQLVARNLIEFARKNKMPQQATKLSKATRRGGRLDRQMDELTGAARIPANRMLSTVSGQIRAWQNMAKLGSVIFSAIDDIEFAASELQFSGRSFIQAHMDVVEALFRNKTDPEIRRIIAMTAPTIDALRMGALHRITADDGVPGLMGSIQGIYFKLNLLTPWTDNFKVGLSLGFASELASQRRLNFKALPDDLQRVFSQYGIDEARWDIYRKSVQKDANGREFIAADDFDDLPDATIEPLVQDKVDAIRATIVEKLGKIAKGKIEGKKVVRADLEKLAKDVVKGGHDAKAIVAAQRQIKRLLDKERRALSTTLRAYYVDRTERGVITPDARVRSFMRGGTQRGTGIGTAVEFLGQFKSFTAAVAFGPLAREIYGRQTNRNILTLRQALIASPGSFVKSGIFMAAFMTMRLTAIAYVSLALKDIARGRKPRLPTDPDKFKENFFAAMAQGGGLPIFADILFGEYKDRYGENAISQFAGPTAGVVGDLSNIVNRIVSGDPAAAEVIRTAQQNAPFVNLFYTRLIFDYALFYNMREALDPGFVDRIVAQSRRDAAQEFIFPPNKVIPRGGGTPLEILSNIGENIGEG